MICKSILDLVGATPVLKVNGFKWNLNHQLFLKLESFNPTLSLKDRAALNIIKKAEQKGLLVPGGTIIESTSGNFGKSLAMLAAVRGYQVVIVVDSKVPSQTLSFYKALGAHIEMVTDKDEDGGYQKSRINRVKELLASNPSAFWTNQYDNIENMNAHSLSTAAEIVADFEELDAIVASVSTGGHITGLAKTLKRSYDGLDVVAADVKGSAAFGFQFRPYLLNGIGLSWAPNNLHKKYVDWLHIVSDEDAISACRLATKSEGFIFGGSGGAVVFACLSYLARQTKPCKILGIIPDSGMNYLDSIYSDDWVRSNDLLLSSSIGDLMNRAAGETQLKIDQEVHCELEA